MALIENVEESSPVWPTETTTAQDCDSETPERLIREVGRRLSVVGDEITLSYAIPEVSGCPMFGARLALKWGVFVLWHVLVDYHGLSSWGKASFQK